MSIRPVLQIFAHAAGAAFRVLPRKQRYGAARRIAAAIAPLVKRSPYFQRRPSLLDGPGEEALRIILRAMTRARVLFDPRYEVIGRELVANRPVLIISAHFLLNIHMSRMIQDEGRRFFASLGGPREPMYYFGTREPLDFHFADATLFVRVRKTIAQGHVAFVIAELEQPCPDWSEVKTVAGSRYVSPAVFGFVERTRIPAVFGVTYLNANGQVTMTFEAPKTSEGKAMQAEFCEFLARHAAAVQR